MPDLIGAFIPLGSLIALGFVMGRFIKMDLKTLSSLAIYGFVPIVGAGAAAQMKVSGLVLLLPILTFGLSAIVGLSAYYFARQVVQDKSLANLLPEGVGSGNTGYFGFPVALALFGTEVAGLYMVANLGVIIYDTTVGYYFLARGGHGVTPRRAILSVLKLPLLYSLIAGLIWASLKFPIPESALKLWDTVKGGYVCTGMMIIGVALAQQKRFELSPILLGISVAAKFLVWPLVAIAVIVIDKTTLHLFNPTVYSILILISVAPMPANVAAYAAQHGGHVDQAASLVLITTIMAVLGLPFVLPLLLGFVGLG